MSSLPNIPQKPFNTKLDTVNLVASIIIFLQNENQIDRAFFKLINVNDTRELYAAITKKNDKITQLIKESVRLSYSPSKQFGISESAMNEFLVDLHKKLRNSI